MCLKFCILFLLFFKLYNIKVLYSKILNLRYIVFSECLVKVDVVVGVSKINMILLWFYILVFFFLG